MTTATQTRAERIEEYIDRDAWASVLYKVADAISAFDEKSDDLIADAKLADLIMQMGSDAVSPIEDELWPGGDGVSSGGAESDAAMTRTMALEAAILIRLTTTEAQEYLRYEGARMAALAASRMKAADSA